MSDNDGEFTDELLCELCEQFNISIKSTAAEAPTVLSKIINKLLLDNYSQYSIDVIISWAVSARNALHTCYRFSLDQLVSVRNPNLPSNLINFDISKTDIIEKYLNALHAA